ncbi:hypothetical protein NIE88_04875 [Sporolactobacillus shoreicorticis]|uniref:Uncharacterized protein n=1 Tax=Sporolactobacillus shoreicorticis TaxID=1923877 RepID=A0ABW5RZZ2_9BACL|nr:hypothetical protein [Sporolactobacillus shoreicorticis]MCO7125107.1 hypothetical protein [Sporolactobacillus shoreicorticis]
MNFYYINDLKLLGKVDQFVPYLYQKGRGWVVDNQNLLMDRLMGYDSGEKSLGNTSTLTLIDEITEEQANQKIKELEK